MKYTFTDKNGKDRTVSIPDTVIVQGRKEKMTLEETIERYLSDEGYIVNDIVAELTAKAKSAGINGAGRQQGEKKQRKAPVRKPDLIKRMLIEGLSKHMTEAYAEVENVEVVNVERIISFSIGEDKYEITLSKKRKPKK